MQKVGASLTLVVQISSFILRRDNLRGLQLAVGVFQGVSRNGGQRNVPSKSSLWSFFGRFQDIWCFLKRWYPQNTPKWSFLVGKPMVVGYHHFRKPLYVYWERTWWRFYGFLLGSRVCQGGLVWYSMCLVSTNSQRTIFTLISCLTSLQPTNKKSFNIPSLGVCFGPVTCGWVKSPRPNKKWLVFRMVHGFRIPDPKDWSTWTSRGWVKRRIFQMQHLRRGRIV